MKRHLHMFEGVAARFGRVTMDRRVLWLPNTMYAKRVIASRDLPIPLFRATTSDPATYDSPPVPIGGVCALYSNGENELVISGILDLNEMDQAARETLLSGGEVPAGVGLDQVVNEAARGLPHPDVLYVTDWRVTSVVTGSLYRSAWDPPTCIKLQTGYYADWSKFPDLFPSDQGDPK